MLNFQSAKLWRPIALATSNATNPTDQYEELSNQDQSTVTYGGQTWTMEDLSSGVDNIRALDAHLQTTPATALQINSTMVGTTGETPREFTLLLWIGCDCLYEEDFKKYGPSGYYFFTLVDNTETQLLELLERHQAHLCPPGIHSVPDGEFLDVYNRIETLCKNRTAPRYYFANPPDAPVEYVFKITGAKTVIMY